MEYRIQRRNFNSGMTDVRFVDTSATTVSFSGITLGDTVSAPTISGGTLYGDGSNLNGITTTSERVEIYNTVATVGFETVPQTVNLNETRINSAPSLFTVSASEITINENINSLISYRVSTEIDGGSSRSTSTAWLELDSGSGFTEVDGSRVFMYNRTVNASVASGSGNILLNLSSGDKVRLRVQRKNGSDTLNTVIDGCNLSIIDLKGGSQGPQGPKGDDGTPGGPPGPQGPNGYGVFAFSRIALNGSILDSRGFSAVTNVSAGVYDYTFSTPSDNANYVVAGLPYSTLTDTNLFISNTTVNGFRVTIGVGDNGGAPDTPTNTEHSITVINASGGLQGISSAYESWLNIGNVGTESDFIDSLVGPTGPSGPSDHSLLNLDDGTNPHGTTKADVGLGSVDDVQQYPNSNPSEFETPAELDTRDTNNRNRANHTGTQLASTISDFDTEVENNTEVSQNTTHRDLTNNPHSVTKAQVGLGNVDNTSDAAKNSANVTLTNKTINLTDNTVNDDSIAQGDLIKSNGTKFVRYANGSPYELLRTNAAGDDLEWSSGPLSFNTTNAGALNTTSGTYTLMTGAQITSVPAGDYFLSFGGWVTHSNGNSEIFMEIYVNGTAVAGSEMKFKRGSAAGPGGGSTTEGTFNYANFPITVGANQTVEIRWRTDAATATITNRYLSIIKR